MTSSTWPLLQILMHFVYCTPMLTNMSFSLKAYARKRKSSCAVRGPSRFIQSDTNGLSSVDMSYLSQRIAICKSKLCLTSFGIFSS